MFKKLSVFIAIIFLISLLNIGLVFGKSSSSSSSSSSSRSSSSSSSVSRSSSSSSSSSKSTTSSSTPKSTPKSSSQESSQSKGSSTWFGGNSKSPVPLPSGPTAPIIVQPSSGGSGMSWIFFWLWFSNTNKEKSVPVATEAKKQEAPEEIKNPPVDKDQLLPAENEDINWLYWIVIFIILLGLCYGGYRFVKTIKEKR